MTVPPAQPTQPVQQPAVQAPTNIRGLVSIAETLAFLVAVVLYALGYHTDGIITALSGTVAHGLLHN